ncbi:MAG TPA: DUF2271 domain-containing protein [Polyangiales bacterium]|nr:DUF2271 domain-containing protein [Polyangiales bacterium]
MSFTERNLRSFGLAAALLAIACVEARPEEPLGEAQFVASGALATQDYVPAGPRAGGSTPGTSGAGSTIPPKVATAGTGNVSQPPAATASQPTAGSAPQAGSGAAGSSAAGRGGAAGMSAAGETPVTGGASAMPPGAGATAPTGTQGTLTIDFKSVTSGGNYAPRNVGAVWIETAAGMFVKTIERWAGIRANHLTAWNAASSGWGSIFGGGNTADMLDAVSRATLRSHEMHQTMWNMKDSTGKVVADGMYNLVIECTEDNRRAGPVAKVAFMKSPTPQMVTAPDKAPYTGLVLNYQP